jgi:hypothetical protein
MSNNCENRFASFQICMRDKIEDIKIWTPNFLINLINLFLVAFVTITPQCNSQAKIQIKHVFKQQTLAQRSSSQKRFYRSLIRGRQTKNFY